MQYTVRAFIEGGQDEGLDESKRRVSAKERRKRHEFEKTVLAVGTTFKIIASFARTRNPFSSESPSLPQAAPRASGRALRDGGEGLRGLRPPLQRELHPDSEGGGRVVEDVPEEGSSIKTNGSAAWRRMMPEFVEDTQQWLRECHSRSIV